MNPEILNTLLTGTIGVGILFFLIWILHLPIKNAGIVDLGWGLGFVLLCFIYVTHGEGFNLRNTVLFIMVSLWAGRIVLYLSKRLAFERQEDKRYQKIRREFGAAAWIKFLMIFEFQAMLELVIGIPLLLVSVHSNPVLSWVDMLGIAVFGVALIAEAVSDEQLHAFKRDPSNRGKTCNVGFWRYSRHPNYFFEWLVWVGLSIYALSAPWGWVGIISPIVMLYLLLYVSGVPMAEEQSLKSRGEEYRRYQAVTSIFVPMPVKRTGSL